MNISKVFFNDNNSIQNVSFKLQSANGMKKSQRIFQKLKFTKQNVLVFLQNLKSSLTIWM